MATDPAPRKRPTCLTVDLGANLRTDLHHLRHDLESALGGRRVLTLGDVVRLAIRHLRLSVILHQANDPGQVEDVRADYREICADLRTCGTCPEWLLPGRPAHDTSPTPDSLEDSAS